MKKLVTFLFLLCCFGILFTFNNSKSPLFAFENIEKVCFVDDQDYAQVMDADSVQCGDMFFNFCSFESAKRNIANLKNFQAMQFYFSSTSVEEILETLKAKVVFEESVEGLDLIYAYTPFYSNSVFIKNKKVNMQVACRGSYVVAGFPLILTGF